ncbi:MAG: DUF362 domain-containing protein [Anaerolineaceae bacterium]|nr:DUF362 domain-containing protein [Anaerolineaceae bacterium]
MVEKARVALVRCESYEDEAAVNAAVIRGFELLGGAKRFIKEGEKIVIKPNFLAAEKPEKNVSPHPTVFKAVVEVLQKAGAELSYGDSPGFGRGSSAARRMGYTKIAEEYGVAWADFENAKTTSYPENHFVKEFDMAKGVLEADGLVSLSKMKTHALMRITGAIKNQFGCIPGMRKVGFHARMPDEEKFSKMLVDLNLAIQPRFYVMDGIVAMQGNGPRNGYPYPMKALLFSDDPAALDAVMARMIQLDLKLMSFFKYAAEWGLGNPYNIEIVGDVVEDFIVDPAEFKANRNPKTILDRFGFLEKFLKKNVIARPVIDDEKCVRCGACVRACPVDPKAVNWHDGDQVKAPSYHYEDCIRCYCCQEACPFEAITVETPKFGQFLNKLKI